MNVGKISKTATDALKSLWQEGFFKLRQKSKSIVTKLTKKGNNFSTAELGMALKRAGYLTRVGKRHSYEYIQKYPFVINKTTKHNKK